MSKRKKIEALFIFIFLLFLANFFVWKEIFLLSKNPLEVIFFDIGQGDSIFIEDNQGYQILIDGGLGKLILEKLNKEMPFWDRTIDLVILTHPDYDHLKGLNYVLERYKIENILWTGVKRETKVFNEWQESLEKEKKEGARIIIAQKGQKIRAGQIQFDILYPFENLESEIFIKNSNDSSIVAKLFFGKNSFLFTGDISKKIEKKLVDDSLKLASQVLKIAHHGSKNASSEEFLEKVQPEIAVISCGLNNSYHHPHQEVLDKLKKFAIKILRTDQDGDVRIISDGVRLITNN